MEGSGRQSGNLRATQARGEAGGASDMQPEARLPKFDQSNICWSFGLISPPQGGLPTHQDARLEIDIQQQDLRGTRAWEMGHINNVFIPHLHKG